MREIRIVDQTLRDAHQSLWASRMTTAMMLPVAERMDRIGFTAIDLGGAVHFDVGVRYLKENPWEKTRLIRQKIIRTPMIGMIRSVGGIGFGVVPNDIALLWIERLIASGVKIFRVFDPLLDNDNNIYQFKYAKQLGAYTIGVLPYGDSPVHTDELYTTKAKELIERAGVDALMIKDAVWSADARSHTHAHPRCKESNRAHSLGVAQPLHHGTRATRVSRGCQSRGRPITHVDRPARERCRTTGDTNYYPQPPRNGLHGKCGRCADK